LSHDWILREPTRIPLACKCFNQILQNILFPSWDIFLLSLHFQYPFSVLCLINQKNRISSAMGQATRSITALFCKKNLEKALMVNFFWRAKDWLKNYQKKGFQGAIMNGMCLEKYYLCEMNISDQLVGFVHFDPSPLEASHLAFTLLFVADLQILFIVVQQIHFLNKGRKKVFGLNKNKGQSIINSFFFYMIKKSQR